MKLKFHTYGTGSEFYLFLHGWGSNLNSVSPLLKYLPTSVTVVSLNIPTHEDTTKHALSLDGISKNLAKWLVQEFPERNFKIIGNCSGAIIALKLAQLLPNKIEQLFLIDPFAYFPWYFKLLTNPKFGKMAFSYSFGTSLGRKITNFFLFALREKNTDMLSSFKENDPAQSFDFLHALAQAGNYQQFNGISVPASLIYGEKTFSAVKKSVSLWQEVLPNLTVFKLSQSKHLPLEESPEALSKIIFS